MCEINNRNLFVYFLTHFNDNWFIDYSKSSYILKDLNLYSKKFEILIISPKMNI